MARRLQPTLTDYVVIAINPALIMLLITSLVYFLLELCYQGHYPDRLHFCLWWFIFGIVLISRISMEEGWDRAAPFGGALALVVAMALNKFVSYQGTNLGEIGWIINYSLMALIWWCAHQLTWDCTLMDESLDTSGEGLLQTVGLDSKPADGAAEKQTDASDQSESKPSDLLDMAVVAKIPDAGLRLSWRRFVERRRRPHAPGVWVVYFSLAALPLFGVGQTFILAANADSRQNAFLLLCVYVACGLGLLLTTSFLSLRRYLRQRRLEMPLSMAGTWLTMGAVLIVSLLLLSALLPRPEAEYSISELPGAVSDEQASSPVAAGKEGTKDEQAASGSGERKGEDEGASKNSKSDGNQPSRSTADQKKDSSQPAQSKDNSSAKSSDSSNQTDAHSQNPPRENEPSRQPAEPNEKPLEIKPPFELSESLLSRVKVLFYGVLGLLVLYWAWRYREELLAWLLGLFSGLSWGRLAGGGASADKKTVPIRHKSFFEYPDPFTSGMAARYSPEQLVRYSFEAFEAWGRDNGWPRREDQTANEFARQLGEQADYLAVPAKALADLYSRAAYAPGTLPPTSVEQLRLFWQSIPRTASGASGSFPR